MGKNLSRSNLALIDALVDLRKGPKYRGGWWNLSCSPELLNFTPSCTVQQILVVGYVKFLCIN